MNLMQPWVESFMEVWKQTKASKDKEVPSVVITDFLEDAYYPELVAFANSLIKTEFHANWRISAIWIMMVRICFHRKQELDMMPFTAGR